MAKFSIALYLGESYASVCLYEPVTTKGKKTIKSHFSKSVFLSQVSLKTLLTQVKGQLTELNFDLSDPIPVYIVTKYLDRLRQFRLGGSVCQVLQTGFENSYTFQNSKHLSLAATQLIISISEVINENWLSTELERVKKINPDLNKVVFALPEDRVSHKNVELLNNFFTQNEIKIFQCGAAHNQRELRRSLLNAGTEGIKEEIISDIHEYISTSAQPQFFIDGKFKTTFENCELFHSLNSFLKSYLIDTGFSHGAYFDLDGFVYLSGSNSKLWESPWGEIPLDHPEAKALPVHPFSEVRLNHFSQIDTDSQMRLFEPGPIIAGRGIKPLVIDLFASFIESNSLLEEVFPVSSQANTRSKLSNTFTVLEKTHRGFDSESDHTLNGYKNSLVHLLDSELEFNNLSQGGKVFGALAADFTSSKNCDHFNIAEQIAQKTSKELS